MNVPTSLLFGLAVATSSASLAADATTGAPVPGAGPSALFQFFPLILIAVIFYLLVLRPQQQKTKEHRELVSRLKAGDKVVTSAGIYGEVVGVEETTLTLRVAEGVEMRFVRSAVSTVLSPNEADAAGKPAEKPAEKWSNRPGRRK